MRAVFGFAVALMAAVVPLVSAQNLNARADTDTALLGLPACAAVCLADGIAQSTCATNPTLACLCTNASLQGQITLCVSANCTIKEGLVTKNITTHAVCGAPIHDLGATYDATSITLAIISCTIVVVRLAFKLIATRSLSADDYVVFILMLVGVPSVLITHYGTRPNGVGRDVWTLTPENITDFQYYFFLMAIFYFTQVMLIKLCLLLFYLRIFPSQGVRRLLWGTFIFDVLFGLVFFFLAIFQCTPVSFYWQGWDGEHEGKCLDKNAIAWANAAISIALDVWMLAIPLAQLNTLKLHWKKKIGVGMMFLVGTFVTIVSIVRLQALVTFAKSSNATYDNFPVSLWSTVEINVGIMCTCMPTLRLLLVRLFPTLGSGSSYGKAYHYNSGAGGQMPSSRMHISQRHGMTNLTSTSNHAASVEANSSVETVPAKELGIVRHQTFAVQYDDDETSLVQMRAMGRGAGGGYVRDDLT